MTAFSIQPIRKNGQQIMFSQLREAVANFNIPVLMAKLVIVLV